MRKWIKVAAALGFVGAAAIVGTALGSVGAGAHQGGDGDKDKGPRKAHGHRFDRRGKGFGRNLVHGEMKIQVEGGFALVTVDRGEVVSVNPSTKTLTFKRADDEQVTVTASDDTKVMKDRRKVAFDAIQVGDLVGTIQVTQDGKTVLRAIRARSAGEPSQSAPAPQGAALDHFSVADLAV